MRETRTFRRSLSLAALFAASVLGACSDDEGNGHADSAGTGGGGRAGSGGRVDASAATGGSSAGSGGTQGASGSTSTGGSGGNLDAGSGDDAAGGATAGSAGADASTGSGGTAGASGVAGSSGALGSSGNGGSNGAAGSTGNGGALGASGSRGNGGTSGAAGAVGSGGASGKAGSAGSSGSTGSGGTAGKAGSAGTAGSSGAGGSAGKSGSGGAAGASGSAGSGGTGGSTTCMTGDLLNRLGKNRMLVGAAMSDATAKAAPFDVRYLYLAGGIFDGSAPCSSCATNCNAGGKSCVGGACNWWGCWQYDQVPPGQYLRDFLNRTQTDGQIPMVTYYEILQASGAAEGSAEVAATNNVSLMTRYFADWRFLLQQIGTRTALLHIEPDFWGYAEQVNANPTAIPAAVASANATDCASQGNNIAGMARCMIAMVRKYAPNARVGLHASAWGTGIDVHLNSNPSFNIPAEAQKLGRFMTACGADTADFVVVEASDRDAGYYTSIGQNRWWDATNATLPNFNQAFTWAKALAEEVRKPLVWWQLPLGNMSLANQTNAWRDNRVDYFFSHTQQIVTAHGALIAFGAGAGGQTTPETDGGNFISKVNAYKQAGGQVPCP